MATATLTRTTTRTRPVPNPAGGVPRAPRVGLARPQPVSAPAGLEDWRERVAALPDQAAPSSEQIAAVLAGVRQHTPLAELSSRTGLDVDAVLDVVVGVGSRLSQANKTGPKAGRCLTLRSAGRAGLDGPGVHQVDGELVVVLAAGWERTAPHGRDVARAYGAVSVTTCEGDARATERWLATLETSVELTYHHFAHLYAVAAGTMPTFTGLTDDPAVQRAYVEAFEIVTARVSQASAAVSRLCTGNPTPARVLELLRSCFWMVPQTRHLAAAARAAQDGRPVGAANLSRGLASLRSDVARRPSLYYPRHLGDIPAACYRVLVAQLGYRHDDVTDQVRVETDLSGLVAALAKTQAKMAGAKAAREAEAERALLSAQFRGVA